MTDYVWYAIAGIAVITILVVIDVFLDRKEKKLYQDGNV